MQVFEIDMQSVAKVFLNFKVFRTGPVQTVMFKTNSLIINKQLNVSDYKDKQTIKKIRCN